MLRPFLIIGVGGSGGKTLRGLRHALELRLQQAGWDGGLPAAWQMLHFDTPIAQDGADYPQPFMPPQNYKGLVAGGGAYESVFGGIVHGKKIASQAMDDVLRQLPDPKRVPVDVTKGAGQFRAVGRAVALSKLSDIAKAASESINTMSDAKALGQLRTLGDVLRAKSEGGVTPNPTVIVISSIAGGSGAGQYIDVIEAIKATAKTQPWAYQFFSLLFAPDVFDQIKGSGGIPSNALATVAETMNGFWTTNPSESTIELFKSKGLTPSYGGARDRVGGAYPFIIGRQNSKISFDNQGEVYSALATSVAAWMTDDRVQGDIDEYATGNWTANVGANKLSDESRLMRPIDQSPPFSSLGFGRVTLGREKFLDYAAERFARSSVDRMLFWHAESDPQFTERTREEWIELKASWALTGFISAARLDEETEERNDVIDALRDAPAQKTLQLEFEKDVLASAGAEYSLDKSGGLDISVWHERLMSEYNDKVERFLSRDTANRQAKLDEWIASQPSHIVTTVEQAIGEHGLPVTVELLNRVGRVVKSASETLTAEAELRRSWIRQLPGYIHEELSRSSSQNSIRPDQEPVDLAIGRIGQAFEWESEARLRDSASALLRELRRDFLDPLRAHLASSLAALQSRVSEQNHSDGRVNEYEFWPRQDDQTVPRKYAPAPNERLLVEVAEYAGEFESLVSSAASGASFGDAMPTVMSSILLGTIGDETVTDPKQRWRLIQSTRSWKPVVTADKTHVVSSPQLPRFTFADQPEVYVDRARVWMLRQGTAFQSYITEDLRTYFDVQHVDPVTFKNRRDKFTEQLRAALGSSEPLVKLNPALLSEVHGKSVGDGTRLVFSSIPFEAGTEMYEVTKHALVTQGVWDDSVSKGWFQDARVDGIEIFAMSGFPYQPFVMDSVMEPIARGWLAESNNVNSRAAFWKWKRSRLLMEAVPADPEVAESIIRGWYVAKALGQLAVDTSDDARGPALSVWDAEHRTFADFPHPLLYPGIAPSNDYPGVVLESLIVAMALISSEGSLRPLHAYHALMELGGAPGQLSRPLSTWIRSGELAGGAPEPDDERAGGASASLSARQDALRAFLESELDDFRAEIATQDARTSVYNYPVSWEIRNEIIRVLGDLRDGVVEIKAAKSGI
ncbi:tubulin-like doman-containing protein [Subtercola boreus]|uniref:Tubulin-like protein n=1 Tax=Subtercola boreus TaxID=120213 RepID=A0A3E0WDK9_9MICO|nr:tubulin-like doman-containing protein [Subtercola boreus]RFA21007.1 hypothetical protein B7R24_06245 [Subtercola boreus]RFA21391.1 hypothetical protein B7R23_06190 [Subtercola boreus]RFA27362.1 hypothetical protein B7R25_06315 [Subtercola boreus]